MRTIVIFVLLFTLTGCVTTQRGSMTSDSTVSTDSYVPVDNSPMVNSDDENAAITEMNDTNAMNASMQAAEEENDEANAATEQTEINAGF